MIIGRDPFADFRIPDPSVSRAHRSVREEGSQVLLCDLDSKNGTKVNGQAVRHAALHEGDRIGRGDVVMKFVSGRLEGNFHEALFGLATLDSLTQLLDRRQFRLLLDEAVATRRPDEALSDDSATTLLDSRDAPVYLDDFLLSGDVPVVPNWKPGRLSAYSIRHDEAR